MKDTDTVTVKEIRAAWQRIDRLEAVGSVTAAELLTDILIHREPEYPYASIWKDHSGVYWFRGTDKTWLRFGRSDVYKDSSPNRPLHRVI